MACCFCEVLITWKLCREVPDCPKLVWASSMFCKFDVSLQSSDKPGRTKEVRFRRGRDQAQQISKLEPRLT